MESVQITAKSKQDIFDEAMRKKIIEREKEIEQDEGNWIDYKESLKDLRKNI